MRRDQASVVVARKIHDQICTRKVTRKFEEDGEARIEGDRLAVNRKGETLINGSFVAALPRCP